MSLEFLRSVFGNLDKITNQSLELLQMADNDGKVGYACRQVELKPDGRLKAFIGEIGDSYIGKENDKCEHHLPFVDDRCIDIGGISIVDICDRSYKSK